MQSMLRMVGIGKRFTGVVALHGVDFEVRAGEVHALLGENGAGKSTLMKVLTGIYQPDDGLVEMDGQKVSFVHPGAARSHGIAIVHQELSLCPNVTVAENIFMGTDTGRLGFRRFKRRDQERRAQALLDGMGLHLHASAVVEDLSIGQRQMVEIAKALSQDVRVLVLDEPTSSLSDADVHFLFTIVDRLKARGVSIVYISHRMKEIFHLCDRATILRDGLKVATLENLREVSQDRVVSLMVGRDLKPHVASQRTFGEVQLEVKGFSRKGYFNDCSFAVRTGEIVGFAGLVGAGRTELMRALVGADPNGSGEVSIEGRPLVVRSVADSMSRGIALVPEDRKRDGLVLEMSVQANLNLIAMRWHQLVTFVQDTKLRRMAAETVRSLNVKTPHLDQEVQYLSGGNQQKVVIGKWLSTAPKLLILDEPTRGIDVGAKAEIYEMIQRLASQGTAIIMVSSELPELLTNCDRIIVMAEGQITGELDRAEATEDAIMALCHLPHMEAVS